MSTIEKLVYRILNDPSTHYKMNAAGHLERMELRLGGVVHVLSPHLSPDGGMWNMLYDLFDEAARQLKEGKVCQFCKARQADPLSEYGWCLKCHFDLTEEILP